MPDEPNRKKQTWDAAFQGCQGAFSEDAALQMLASSSSLKPCARLEDVFEAVHTGAARYGVYPARTGFVALAALEPHFERRFSELLGLPIGADPSSRFLERSAEEWEAWAREHDVPMVAVSALREQPHETSGPAVTMPS